MHRYEFVISEDGSLIIMDNLNNQKTWQGRFFELDVMSIMHLPQSNDVIVLLDWKMAERKSTRNLLRCSIKGEVVWAVGPPIDSLKGFVRRNDVYTSVKYEDEILKATSVESFLDYINAETGEVIKSVFLK